MGDASLTFFKGKPSFPKSGVKAVAPGPAGAEGISGIGLRPVEHRLEVCAVYLNAVDIKNPTPALIGSGAPEERRRPHGHTANRRLLLWIGTF